MESNPTLDTRNKKEIFSEGKTKTLFYYDDPKLSYDNLVRICTKDSLSAFDGGRVASANVARYKTRQTCNVFRLLEKNNIPTSFVKQLDDYNFVANACTMLPYECVMRRRAYGSYLKRFPYVESGYRFYVPVIEFFFKLAIVPPVRIHADPLAIMDVTRPMEEDRARKYYMKDGEWTIPVETDPLLRFNYDEWRKKSSDPDSKDGVKIDVYSAKKPTYEKERLYQMDSSFTPREISEVVDLMQRTFTVLEASWGMQKIDLVDLKIEIGMNYNTGKLVVADVIDNDSWRLWPKGIQSDQLDKQSFRDDEDIASVEAKYKQVTEYTEKFNELPAVWG